MPKICLKDSHSWCLLLIILTMLMQLSGTAAAQQFGFPGGGRRHRSSESQDRQEYNTQTVTTVKGQVESLGSYGMTGWRAAPGMQSQGLVLKTDKGNIIVHLGPPWYVRKQGFDLKQGDSLEVTGSQVTKDGQTLLLAAQAKKDGQTLKVRDEQGVPLWQGEDHGGRGAGGGGWGGMGSGGRGHGGGGQSNW
ncbi:MAG: hypothetical protein WCF59_03445 [Desulfobaccales bacterium]